MVVETAQLFLVDGVDGGEVGVELTLAGNLDGLGLSADLGVDPRCPGVGGVLGPHQGAAQRAPCATCRRRHRRGVWWRSK